MARLISFSMTAGAIRDRSKSVTRRLGWKSLRHGEELRAVLKGMGRKKGEPIIDLARIRVVSVRREALSDITDDDVALEGYPGHTSSWFVAKFCDAMGCDEDTEVARIEFEYVTEAKEPSDAE